MIIDMPNTRTREIAHKIEQLHEERGESATGRVLTLLIATEDADLEHEWFSFISGYSTHFRNSPFAGRVGPAWLRSQPARMPGICSGCIRPAPTSHKVPARMRTMLYR